MQYFRITGLAEYQATEGNLGVTVLRKDEGGQAVFLMITLWESEDAIRKFAGEDISQAKFYPADSQYFDELEPFVAHHGLPVYRTPKHSCQPNSPIINPGCALVPLQRVV